MHVCIIYNIILSRVEYIQYICILRLVILSS